MIPGIFPDVPGSMTPAARAAWFRRYEAAVERQVFVAKIHDWLSTFRWEWFAHLTVDECKGLPKIRKLVEHWRLEVNRRIFGRDYYKNALLGLDVFYVAERQDRGDYHAHALVTGTGGVVPELGTEVWHLGARRRPDQPPPPVRNAKVESFDPGRGGIAYLTNYLDSMDPDVVWDLLGPRFK